MEDGADMSNDWIKSVLIKTEEILSQGSAKANVTLPPEGDEKSYLIFSFFREGEWFGFGVTEDDLQVSPDDLVAEVKEDLGL
jgi:hypothetical protein